MGGFGEPFVVQKSQDIGFSTELWFEMDLGMVWQGLGRLLGESGEGFGRLSVRSGSLLNALRDSQAASGVFLAVFAFGG